MRPLDAKNLAVLARLLVKNPRARKVINAIKTRTHEEHLVMAAPATLAACVDHAGIDKQENELLRVLLINARVIDYLDDGQWYRFVPAILGKKFRVEIVANTLDASRQRESMVPAAVRSGPKIRSSLAVGPVADVLQGRDPREFDLAIVFGHQLSPDDLLMADHGIRSVAAAGVPIYLADFSETAGLLKRTVARVAGLKCELVDDDNRFAMVKRADGKHIGVRWARAISRITGVNDDAPAPDDDDMRAIKVATAMVFQSHEADFAIQPHGIGEALADRDHIHTMDGIAVSRDARVFDLHGELLGEIEDPNARAWIQGYDASFDESDKLIWAAHVRGHWGDSVAKEREPDKADEGKAA